MKQEQVSVVKSENLNRKDNPLAPEIVLSYISFSRINV